ncbi:MAG: UvrD-helicase domain-containing protein [Ktedonobacteraceae bacterium]
MDDGTRAAAVTAAQQLLLRYRAEHPHWVDDKTPVDELVAWLGLQVETFHPADYPAGTYGFLEQVEDLIWLCRDLSLTLRRFTLAHELGHAVLHRTTTQQSAALRTRLDALPPSASSYPQQQQETMPSNSPDDPCQQLDVQEEVTPFNEQERLEEVLGSGQSYNPRGERELAANIFAAELLMPLERVRTLYLNNHVPPHTLAALFHVSNAAMLNRLVGLVTEASNAHSSTQEQAGNNTTQSPAKKLYDEFQQAAIEAPTPALIVAGPGSGKTSTLIGRTDYLIHSLNVPPEHILALTFSRKAAEEMQERLQAILHNDASSERLAMPQVSTFHAFCADILRLYGSIVGLRPDFALIDETEGYFLLRQLTRNMRLYHYRNLKAPAFYFPDILRAISRAKDELVAPEQYHALAQRMLEKAQQTQDEETVLSAHKALEVAHIYALYEEALRRRGDTDFGGLIMLTVQLFKEFPEICYEQQQKFHHILVDEFQDINRASGVLLRQLAGEACRIWVVGDANQSIYAFRGASPANIANFQEDYPGAVVLPLSRNYRSRPDIVQLAEAFRWQQLELGTEVEPTQTSPSRLTHPETYVTVATASDNSNELAGLIADIRYKHAQGYAYRDMAILSRTRVRMEKITRALLTAGLPVIEKVSVLEQEHSKDLLSIVLLMADASGMGLLRAARQREHPLASGDIELLIQEAHKRRSSLVSLVLNNEAPASMSKAGRRSLTRLSSIVQSLFQHASDTWLLLAQYLFIETSLMRDLLTTERSKEQSDILSDYSSLLQLARRYDQQQKALRTRQAEEVGETEEHGEQPIPAPTLHEQAKGLLDYLQVIVSLGQDSGGNRQHVGDGDAEEQPDVLRVMTVHASKGLEFPIVYLPGLIQRNFPMQRHSNPVPPPDGMLPGESAGKTAHEIGEACLFYVGVTRSRDHLVLSYSQFNGKQRAKPSHYLETLLAGLSPERVTHLQWQGLAESAPVEDEEETIVMSSTQPSQHFIEKMKPDKLIAADIENYQRCPRRYLYSTIYGFRGEQGTYLLFWQAMQKTLESLQQTREQENPAEAVPSAQWPTLTEAHNLYNQHWQALGGQQQPFAAVYERHGHEVTELIHHKLQESGTARWELRSSYTVEAAGRTIHVPIDRVESASAGDQPSTFVRTHFGKRKETPTPGTRELLYARASRQHAAPKIELLFHNLSTGETVPIKLTAKKEQNLSEELEQSIHGLEHDQYPALFNARTCPMCPFYLICPA